MKIRHFLFTVLSGFVLWTCNDTPPHPQPLINELKGIWTVNEIKKEFFSKDSISVLTNVGTLEFLACDNFVQGQSNDYCQAVQRYQGKDYPFTYAPNLSIGTRNLTGILDIQENLSENKEFFIIGRIGQYTAEKINDNQFIFSEGGYSTIKTITLTRINE